MNKQKTELKVYQYTQHIDTRGNGGYGAIIKGDRVTETVLCANCGNNALSEVATEEGSKLVCLPHRRSIQDVNGHRWSLNSCDGWGGGSASNCLDQ